MIKATGVSKSFDDIKAVDNVSLSLKEGEVFGLIGTNGAGKSTFLRMMAGVIRPNEGTIELDDEGVYENTNAKSKMMYLSDEQFFYPGSTPRDMLKFYKEIYKDFDETQFYSLCESFGLGLDRKIRTFSKGMKKQLSILFGICSKVKYLFCDETFDGLDPVMRQAVKSLFAAQMSDRDFTPIIASHNLRELEDICDYVGLLHKGGVILSKDLADLKSNIHKVQCVFDENQNFDEVAEKLTIVNSEKRGRLNTLTVRGEKDSILNTIDSFNPVFCEALPLSLEEIFISETGVIGYDIKKLIL